jgi:hypothetical protein
MGTEKDFAVILRAQGEGRPGTAAGLRWRGGTPNHKAEAVVSGYGWGLRNPADLPEARERLLDFLAEQEKTHMAVGGVSEAFTPSHHAWWQAAMAGAWFLAWRGTGTVEHSESDQVVLAAARAWNGRNLVAEDLCATPAGRVVIPGGRSHVGAGNADQTTQRDQGRAIIRKLKGVRIPEGLKSLDRTGLWFLSLLPAAELALVADSPWPLPGLLDPITVVRSKVGHVASFERFRGLRPAWWACADYVAKTEAYGGDPKLPKGAQGGNRPFDQDPPACPGLPGEIRWEQWGSWKVGHA